VVGCSAIPAQAFAPVVAPVVAPVEALRAQAFAAPDFAVPSVARDGFTISRFDLVQWPLPSSTSISDGYGYRSCAGCSTFHEGMDFTPGAGYPVQAIADGVVVEASFAGALGQHVVIQHVIAGEVVLSIYGHLAAGSAAVWAGENVGRGEVVGLVGSTGQSTGPHLHFGIQLGDGLVDPYAWLASHANS